MIQDQIASTLVRYRKHFFIGLLLVCAAMAPFIGNIKVDNSLEVWFLEDDPALVRYQDFKKLYGNDEVIVAYLPSQSGSVYDRAYLETVRKVSGLIQNSEYVRRIMSLTDAEYIFSRGDELVVEDLVNQRITEGSVSQLPERLHYDPKLAELLLDKDASGSVILIEPHQMKEMDLKRPDLIEDVENALVGVEHSLAGMGVMYQELNEISQADAALFTSLAYLLLITLLFFIFRSLKLLMVSSVAVICSVVLMFGVYGFFNQSFNMVSAILPTLLVVTCLADVVHYFTHWRKRQNLEQSLRSALLPCFLTSLTTAIGLLALVLSPMAVLKSFGLFAAIAVMIEFFVAAIVCVFVFGFASDKVSSLSDLRSTNGLQRLLDYTYAFVENNWKEICYLTPALIIIAVFGVSRLEVDTYSMGFLFKSNEVRKDSDKIESAYGNYLPLELRLISEAEGGVKEPAFQRQLTQLQKSLSQIPEITQTYSIADLQLHLHNTITEAGRSIPDSREAIAQELFLYELDEDNRLDYFTPSTFSEARMTLNIPMVSAQGMKDIIGKVKAKIPEGLKYEFGGYVPLYVKMMEYITETQIKSFIFAAIFVFLILGLIFKSILGLCLGVLANLLPISLVLAVMGFVGIRLDIATVTIAAVALGIVVDDTTHFIYRYLSSRKQMTVTDAIQDTLNYSGFAMLTTSILTVLAFSIMLLASIKSVLYFGVLLSLCVLFALIFDLVVLPSLFKFFDRSRPTEKIRKVEEHVR